MNSLRILDVILRHKSPHENCRAAIRTFYRHRYNYDIQKYPDAWDGVAEWIRNLPNKHRRRNMGAGNIIECARTLLKGNAGEDDLPSATGSDRD